MTFDTPDPRRFPGLALAWEVLAGPAGSTAVLNAANEVAVAAFLEGRLNFSGIPAVIEAVMNQAAGSASDLQSVLAADARARSAALQIVDSGRYAANGRHSSSGPGA